MEVRSLFYLSNIMHQLCRFRYRIVEKNLALNGETIMAANSGPNTLQHTGLPRTRRTGKLPAISRFRKRKGGALDSGPRLRYTQKCC